MIINVLRSFEMQMNGEVKLSYHMFLLVRTKTLVLKKIYIGYMYKYAENVLGM